MKQVNLGPLALNIGVNNGVPQVVGNLTLAESLGGGKASGVLTAKANAGFEIDMGAQQGADLAIAALEAVFPSANSFLELVKAGVDAEIAKINV